jgi:dethiobiotin synthetase
MMTSAAPSLLPKIPGLFITGTDTDVGKTYVTALIASQLARAGYRVGVYKPAASGCLRDETGLVSEDALALWNAAGRPDDLEHVCPQRFAAPLAPYLAARQEGRTLDVTLLVRGADFWRERSDILLVEGVGGLLTPITETVYVADLALAFGFPLVVVAKNVLGTINQTLQTLVAAAEFRRDGGGCAGNVTGLPDETARRFPQSCPKFPWSPQIERLAVAGIVFNHTSPPSADDASLATNRQELERHCPCRILTEVQWRAGGFDSDVDWYSLAAGTAT